MNRLETLRLKLVTLKASDLTKMTFGSDTQLFHLPAPLSERDLAVFESANQVVLPEEYRNYLTHVANGGTGPYYGLYSITEALEQTLNLDSTPTGDFYYNNAQVQSFISHYQACLEEGMDENIHYLEVPEPLEGVLFLSEYGCGGFYLLVLTGEQAGTVWYLQEGEYLYPCFEGTQQWGFLNWFEDWLDNSLEALKPESEREKHEIGTDQTLLNYDGHQLTEIPEVVFSNTSLKKLVFSRNSLPAFPEKLTQLTELRNLDLSMNPFVEISEKIGELRKLRKLNLSYNSHTTFPESFANLTLLEELLMYYNYKLEVIPDVVTRLPALRLLNFSHNIELKKIPENIGDLSRLETLNLNDTAIDQLPDSLGQLQNLRHLYLKDTGIKKLPDSFVQLKNLQHLNIGIAELDLEDAIEKIKNLPELRWLTLILQKDYPVALKELTQLKKLTITYNYDLYKSGETRMPLPENLTLIPNLEELELTNNNLAAYLPESMGRLAQLRVLSLSATAIQHFPESLQYLTRLEVIEGNLNKDPKDFWGIFPAEKQKVTDWFPAAKIYIW